jgi:hypothetical protein
VIDIGPCDSDDALPGNWVQTGKAGCKRDKLLLITIRMKREQDGLYRGVRHMSRLEVGLGDLDVDITHKTRMYIHHRAHYSVKHYGGF